MSGTPLQKGGNIALPSPDAGGARVQIHLGWKPREVAGMEVDASAFLLDADGKVRGDQDMVFYNNPRSSEGTVEARPAPAGADDAQVFALDLAATPTAIRKIAFTVTIHEGQERQQNFGLLQAAWARVVAGDSELARFELPLAGTPETAMIFCEVYRHNEGWKFRAVGQGYVGGLGPLAVSYGIDLAPAAPTDTPPATEAAPPPAAPSSAPPTAAPVESPTPPPATPPPTASAHGVRLEKRLVDLEKKDPDLVNLVKRTGVELAKHGLEQHNAKVALCLDISGSMHSLYSKGSINTLVRRVLALGFRFDDDGEIDVFLFGQGAYHGGTVNADNYQTFVADTLRRYKLEAGTNYGKVMAMVRAHYREQPSFGQIPVYVMFATDGDTTDRADSERQIVDAAREGIFWQFMAIGTPPAEKKGFFSRLLSADFQFLQHLDTMRNRFLDNANFFLVKDPAEPSDEELVGLMMAEYPSWLKAARAKALLR